MEALNHIDSIFNQDNWIDKCSLMANKFSAHLIVLREVFLHEILKLVVVFEVNRVPKFGVAMMKIIYAVEVKIFLMPAEHGLPASHVNIRICDPGNFLISETIAVK